MSFSDDPVTDTMQDRIEEKLRNLMIASSDFDALKVFYRGEPGFVPVKLYPFAVIFLAEEQEAIGQEGYEPATGLTYYRYDGYVSLEVLFRDTNALMPDSNRKADVGSYLLAKQYTQATFKALMAWGGPQGHLEEDPVISNDGKEQTVEMVRDSMSNGLGRRGDNVSNRGNFAFHLYTVRRNW